jgi:DNA-binding transcriptional LysR family regulator
MDAAISALDWSLIRAFLAVAETGSLSSAARRLGCSQPTLGRQVKALESALEVALFRRHARGLDLTDTGRDLLDPARRMRAAMTEIALTAAGRSQRLDGTVRISASVFAAHHILPPILAAIRAAEPAIQLDLVPSDTTENLLFREADIAIRMYRPTQADIVARQVGTAALGAFAARSYLDRVGRPATTEAALALDLVGYDGNDLIVRTMAAMGIARTREDFATRCDLQSVYWELVRAGCGVGFGQRAVGRADPLVEELELAPAIPPLPVWLAAHPAMRQTPRIARVWDLLARGLRASPLLDRQASANHPRLDPMAAKP